MPKTVFQPLRKRSIFQHIGCLRKSAQLWRLVVSQPIDAHRLKVSMERQYKYILFMSLQWSLEKVDSSYHPSKYSFLFWVIKLSLPQYTLSSKAVTFQSFCFHRLVAPVKTVSYLFVLKGERKNYWHLPSSYLWAVQHQCCVEVESKKQ